MPRFETGSSDGGLVVDGIYGGLLERERVKCLERDPRFEPGAGPFVRPRGCLNALEAGLDVIVGRRTAEMVVGFRFRLPWDRSVKSVRVSSDDVVRPTSAEHPWYGCASDEANFG